MSVTDSARRHATLRPSRALGLLLLFGLVFAFILEEILS